MSVSVESSKNFGYGFISDESLPKGKDEYYHRFKQNPKESYRHLDKQEIMALEKNGNLCSSWKDVLVEEPFLPFLIKNNSFYGLVRIGSMKDVILKYHDFAVPSGITNSVIISCDIGSCTAIHFCSYLSHYIIKDNVILNRIDEMSVTNHAKFGEGIVKDGENEDVRIKIDVINESGGRDVYPFKSMLMPDAYIWAKYRGDATLIKRLEEMTQAECDSSRGYYGVVERESVIKSCRIIKDVYIGEFSYIKGANKLKNLTILSSEDEPSQIGEGVELVNGIIGEAAHIFYGVKAVRFVVGKHCTLKYGARLIHSILGDNSTISCCEVLNSLIFPFHEQHHNNSFLIASVIMGQSNMAAGATVGSNHNTRGNDGEVFAGRGFWPCLSTTLKHNSKFASFMLIDKGSYCYELNIPFPFSLIINNEHENVLEIMPSYYWMYNMYALERNMKKYVVRDKRKDKSLKIETEYLAPDTATEILKAIDELNFILKKTSKDKIIMKDGLIDIIETSSENIEKTPKCPQDKGCSPRHVRFLKFAKAMCAYKEMLTYYGVKTLSKYFEKYSINFLEFSSNNEGVLISMLNNGNSSIEWVNLGGVLMPKVELEELIENIKTGALKSWKEIHLKYLKILEKAEKERALHAYFILARLSNFKSEFASIKQKFTNSSEACKVLGLELGNIRLEARMFSWQEWNEFVDDAKDIREYMTKQVFYTKQKDYDSFFRKMVYDSDDEMNAVLHKLEDNPVIKDAKIANDEYCYLFEKMKITNVKNNKIKLEKICC